MMDIFSNLKKVNIIVFFIKKKNKVRDLNLTKKPHTHTHTKHTSNILLNFGKTGFRFTAKTGTLGK